MRVLIVEDEPKMAALVRRGLVEEGHAADGAAQGEDAVWMADAHPYDAIVLDVMLPGVEADPLVLSADRLRLEQASTAPSSASAARTVAGPRRLARFAHATCAITRRRANRSEGSP